MDAVKVISNPYLRIDDSYPKSGLERFRDYIGRTCCSCFLKLPVVVIVIAICILVALLLALIPAVVILTSAVESEAQRQVSEGVDMQIIRNSHIFPKPDPLDDEDDILDGLRRSGITTVHGIPSTALFPPNVSLCEGFGFACTIQPSTVISTALRCDGKSDCPDGSDELNCKECQSAFSCSISKKSKVKVCLRAEQLCDGIAHCPDEYDEHEHCKEECGENELKCPSTTLCLPPESICDGVVDCDTEDDETNCKKCKRGAQVTMKFHKLCKPTNRCIPPGQLCDGIPQCPDGSDEKVGSIVMDVFHSQILTSAFEDCDCRSCCGSGKALCSDGTCLERSRVCDGVVDCSDGVDEEDCPGTCILSKNAKIPQVVCADGRRYPRAEACSGVIEQCAYNCTECDKQLAFTCKDKKCIPQMLVCDGIDDCLDGEDENDCSCTGLNKFECRSASGKPKCISKQKVCDGVWDCMDGKDETNCNSVRIFASSYTLGHFIDSSSVLPMLFVALGLNKFECRSASGKPKCISKQKVCDGVWDCMDGKDETNCNSCPSNALRCPGEGTCIPKLSRCDGIADCRDGSDETDCTCEGEAGPADFFGSLRGFRNLRNALNRSLWLCLSIGYASRCRDAPKSIKAFLN
ncbi:unnamed protein product [Haemonchus placei]|uniref:Uncharacterized protein n=1 Tax=Haemonchus placei TaxID=6290 RepID=A0A3P8A4M6_HAEPC|nr:unnamed protein product [Haemonchus placei]